MLSTEALRKLKKEKGKKIKTLVLDLQTLILKQTPLVPGINTKNKNKNTDFQEVRGKKNFVKFPKMVSSCLIGMSAATSSYPDKFVRTRRPPTPVWI